MYWFSLFSEVKHSNVDNVPVMLSKVKLYTAKQDKFNLQDTISLIYVDFYWILK